MSPGALPGPRRSFVVQTPTPRPRRRCSPRAEALESRSLLTINFQFDYRFDTSNFFDTQAKRDLLASAARSIGSALGDRLAAIAPTGGNTWSATIYDPITPNAPRSIDNLTVPTNTLTLFVGGRTLVGTEAGFGGPGGFNATGTGDWVDTVVARGQPGALNMQAPSDFAPWGGSLWFDTSGTNWYFGDDPRGLQPNQTDFYSVALHELGHILGIGDVPSDGRPSPWTRYVSGGTFIGPNAEAANGGQAVPLESGGGHWASGVTSAGAPALMTPVLSNGTRRLFTPLDLAGLRDVGWQVATPGGSVQFASPVVRVLETDGLATIAVARPDGGGSASVDYATVGGTGIGGTDYLSQAGTLNFAPGQTTATVTVPVLHNPGSRLNHVVNVMLSNPVGTTLGAQVATSIVILDTDRPPSGAFGDFDGDGKADPALFRSGSAQWLILQSTLGGKAQAFGSSSLDVPLEGDFDGDGKLDFAVFRPSTAQWFILYSGGGAKAITFGATNLDVPIPADYDGDGKTDLAVFRPTTAQWFILRSTAGGLALAFGAPNLDRPVPADYDGDGKADLAVFRPTAQAQWFILQSSAGPRVETFGSGFDLPVPADYDGDGRADLAVYRASTSQWFLSRSLLGPTVQPFGGVGDIPVPADYDGDGRADVAVYRPSTAQWFLLQSSAGPKALAFGGPYIDYPLPTPLAYRYGVGLRARSLNLAAPGTAPARSVAAPPIAAPLAWVDGAEATATARWSWARRRGMFGQIRSPSDV